jgi:hypothetical protein
LYYIPHLVIFLANKKAYSKEQAVGVRIENIIK